jgi:hypothetical protein
MLRRALIGLAATVLLSSCATYSYDKTPRGTLKGQLMVVWVGEDRFVYWPNTKDPLRYERADGSTLPVASIRPGLMYTDGGSIPRPLRGLQGFSPWGYAPAYVVHDWLFAAHHCLVAGLPMDPRDKDELEKVRALSFKDSIDALAEVMRTLMADKRVKTNPAAFDAISFGVETTIAENLWNSGKCETVSAEDLAKIENAQRTKTLRMLSPFSTPPANAEPPIIVYQNTFGR